MNAIEPAMVLRHSVRRMIASGVHMSRVFVLQGLVMIGCGTQGPSTFDVTIYTSAAPAAVCDACQ
jgi:hypothetical protein